MTVEELRDKIYTKAAAHIGILESEFSCSPDENRTYEELTRELATDLYALISASHAEGVEEGEERQLVRILEQSYLKDAFNNPLVTLPVDFYVVPKSALIPKDASVLAPKEKP
jgi:hypothetical protein